MEFQKIKLKIYQNRYKESYILVQREKMEKDHLEKYFKL